MAGWEYKVVPAPKRGVKLRGAKSTEDRFAVALEDVMNDLGAQGWDYVRSDTLPVEERQGLTGRATTYQNMLVFRRARPPVAGADATARDLPAPPVAAVASPAPAATPAAAPAPAAPVLLKPAPAPATTPALGPAIRPDTTT